ncbi:prepilin peptidase [Methylobacterium sp. J-076]|uniref:prepilin peptidase n=1 Tax=Methylobacterium sp. J-076 TaxID=2836655 RepID=UPI001FB91A27|nr:A24 family peptidase [Methylobacterium sp. J-076]MCJ2012632.1 A24 family peptidase [Methylobacterium sp. J-076]
MAGDCFGAGCLAPAAWSTLLSALPSAPLPTLLLLPLTVPVAVIDLRRRIIPDGLNLALLAAGLGLAAYRAPDPQAVLLRIAEVAVAFGLFWSVRALHARLRGRIGLGLGDVKFLAAATAWTGLAQVPLLILVASLAALAGAGLAALVGRRIGRATRLPFGPFLALGLHVALLLPPPA